MSYGAEEAQPIRLEELDPLVFSEVMRDVDLFVGVASIGNDPQWADGGGDIERADYWSSYSFGEFSATGTTRKEQLERLVPRLKTADRCSFEGNRTLSIILSKAFLLAEDRKIDDVTILSQIRA